MKKNKVLIIVGPTASGKSDLAVRLARKFNGEIISADSRQVYKGLDIGSGKITKQEMQGIPHHLLDIASPKTQFSASDYIMLTNLAIAKIVNNGKLPFVVGGTGFYIDALVGTTTLPNVPPDKLLRSKLNKLSTEQLFKMLKTRDPERAKTIDQNNKVRLVRALEIIAKLGRVPPPAKGEAGGGQFIWIGLKPDILDEKIHTRLDRRWTGIVREVKRLHKQGLSWKRMYELGLEYRYVSLYVRGKLTKEEAQEKLFIEIRRYAKRQMTWWKRNGKIKWFNTTSYKQTEEYVREKI